MASLQFRVTTGKTAVNNLNAFENQVTAMPSHGVFQVQLAGVLERCFRVSKRVSISPTSSRALQRAQAQAEFV
jgi:hypothetical protein